MCSACDYTNSNSVWEMRKHCVAQHGGAAEAISNEEKHKDLIGQWNQKCFPDWKQKKVFANNKDGCRDEEQQYFDINDELSKSIEEVINMPITIQDVHNADTQQSPTEASNVATSSSSVNDESEYPDYSDEIFDNISGRCSSVNESVTGNGDTSSKAQSSNDRICHLCW